MSLITEEPRLVFFAEGEDADEYFNMIDESGEAAVIDQIVGGNLLDTELEDTPGPRDEDDESFEHDDGYTLVYNPRRERIWLFERSGVE